MEPNLKTFPMFKDFINLFDYCNAVEDWRLRHIEKLQNLKPFVLTKVDHLNIQKWQTATSMIIQAKMRTPYSQSEHDTSNKLMQIVDRAFIPKDEVLGVQK